MNLHDSYPGADQTPGAPSEIIRLLSEQMKGKIAPDPGCLSWERTLINYCFFRFFSCCVPCSNTVINNCIVYSTVQYIYKLRLLGFVHPVECLKAKYRPCTERRCVIILSLGCVLGWSEFIVVQIRYFGMNGIHTTHLLTGTESSFLAYLYNFDSILRSRKVNLSWHFREVLFGCSLLSPVGQATSPFFLVSC